MYFKDFSSGAMIENIVRRAKKLAIKRVIAGGDAGHPARRPVDSIHQEYKEHEDLPNTTNPDDWAKISGKKGERIVYVRTLVNRGRRRRGRGRPVDRAGRHRPVPLRPLDPRAGWRPGSSSVTGRLRAWPSHKICGIETEYGIVLSGACRVPTRSRPRRSSSTPTSLRAPTGRACSPSQGRAGTSRTSRPGTTPVGSRPLGTMAPEVETHLVNAVLTNGARYYVDHAHPELSTPECADARSVVVWDQAAERILVSVDACRRRPPFPPARRSSSTRTTPTARATATGATRTT